MTTRDLFLDLYRHMEWADASMWRAVLGSDAALADAALRERLHHLHQVQRRFLSIWRGEPVDRQAGVGLDTASLASWARQYYPQARMVTEGASEAQFDAPLPVPWSRSLADRFGDEPKATTLGELMVHVYAHTAHHRGQIATALRALGATPPTIDYIAWVWQGRPAPPW